MKVNNFAISVQWGEGPHYFHSYAESEIRAIMMTHEICADMKKRYPMLKGAKPKIMIWQLLQTKNVEDLVH